MEIKTMEQFNKIVEEGLLPQRVVEDIIKRLNDWRESGGSMDDDNSYIKQQLRYAEMVIQRSENTQNI